MRKSVIAVGTIALFSLGNVSAWAGNLTVPNVFVSGTKAVAADVNANFNAVETAVNDNDTRITQNTADVTANTAEIGTKADAATVTANTAAIGTKADIATVTANTAAIATNAANISANTTAIGTKADAATVTVNTAAIATNTSNITALQQNGNKTGIACAGNDINDVMVRVGPLCVDKYEASVWSTTDGSASGTQLGDGSDNYSTGTVNAIVCSDNANDCTGPNTIYARSVASVHPSSNITWFQAQQACAASGKRLLTNAEWQMAAAGTDKANCNVSGGLINNTDGNPACLSNWGVADMVGNVNEWVADWMQGAKQTNITADEGGGVDNLHFNIPTYTTGSLGANYDTDTTAGVQVADTTNFPAAIYRGGGAGGGGVFQFVAGFSPAFSNSVVGFRCAR